MTWIFIWDTAPSKIFVGDTQVSKVFVGDTQVRPTLPDYLCFTANTAWSTIALNKSWTPTSVTLETSTNWTNWTTYTFWTTITLSNVWDKVYWRNTSETDTWFSIASNKLYQFSMTWSINWSGDINFLLNKNSTTTLSSNCYNYLFNSCYPLRTCPKLTATTLAESCYENMFYRCSNLTTLPKLPATTLANNCYAYMFGNCSGIKISKTKTWSYQTAYRIPTTWTWTAWTWSLSYMFASTWWTFTWTPSINTTYYTSNTLV